MFGGKRKDVTVETEEYGSVIITIQKLNDRSLSKAQKAKKGDTLSDLRAMGGELFRAIKDDNLEKLADQLEARKKAPTLEEMKQARYNEFDRDAIVQAGVVSWSIEAQARLFDSLPNLDRPTAEFLHEEIVDWSLGPIDPAEVEAAPKG